MASLFKMNPKTPLMKALVGKQKNLTDPKKGRTLADMKKGQYGTIRPMTDQEAAAYAAKTGTTRLGVRQQEKKYMSKAKGFQSGMTDAQKSRAKMESTQGGSQMGKIISAGGKGGEKGIAEEAKRRSAGKSPAKMTGGKSKAKQASSGIGPKAKIEKSKNTTPKLKQTKAESSKNYKTGVKSPAKMKGVKGLKK